MCGIIAYSGKSEYDKEKMKSLFLINSLERGVHATGYFTPEQGLNKKAVDAISYFNSNDLPDNNLLIGHVRAATIGKKDEDKNAHPFEFDHIVGLHNGTLTSYLEAVKNNDLTSTDYNVDSEMLYAVLNKRRTEEKTYYKALEEFAGPMALVWYDKIDNVIYVYRNIDRPLYRGKIGDGIYISSEKKALEWIKCNNIKEFKNNNLYIIKDGEIISSKIYIKNKEVFTSNNTSDIDDSYFYMPGRFNGGTFNDNLYVAVYDSPNGKWLENVIANNTTTNNFVHFTITDSVYKEANTNTYNYLNQSFSISYEKWLKVDIYINFKLEKMDVWIKQTYVKKQSFIQTNNGGFDLFIAHSNITYQHDSNEYFCKKGDFLEIEYFSVKNGITTISMINKANDKKAILDSKLYNQLIPVRSLLEMNMIIKKREELKKSLEQNA